LFLEFPADKESASRDDEYLLGADLLAAPVLQEGATEREIYLPPGEWFALGSAARETGGRSLRIAVTPESLPLYVRGGAFLFTQPVVQHTGEMAGKTLTVQVYPASESQGSLYEDDGSSLAYRSGAYARRNFSQRRADGVTVIKASAIEGHYRPAPRALVFSVFGDTDVTRVELNGKTIGRSDDADFDRGTSTWTVRDGALEVKLQDGASAQEIRIIHNAGAKP